MYSPRYFLSENQNLALELIRDYPLGLLISQNNGKLESSYLPFLVDHESQDVILWSHCAKANPQWRFLKDEVLISFQGPSGYVSPNIYIDKMNVPTWNYAVVQVHGTVEVLTDQNSLKDILHQSVRFFESQNQTNWSYNLPEEIQEKLEAAIVGLKIKITHIDAKFKLSQNRSAQDYKAVLNFFKDSTLHKDRELYEWMLKSR